MDIDLVRFHRGVFIWPIALTHNFGWLLLWNLLFALGMGMLLSVHAVYISELAPPQHRQKLAMRSQAIAPIAAGLLAGLTSFYWVPLHFQWFIYALSAAPIVLCIPIALIWMPESPRWLEGKGRVEDADKIVSKWEASAERRFGKLPAPNLKEHTVIQTEHVPAKEVFTGKYRTRTLHPVRSVVLRLLRHRLRRGQLLPDVRGERGLVRARAVPDHPPGRRSDRPRRVLPRRRSSASASSGRPGW